MRVNVLSVLIEFDYIAFEDLGGDLARSLRDPELDWRTGT